MNKLKKYPRLRANNIPNSQVEFWENTTSVEQRDALELARQLVQANIIELAKQNQHTMAFRYLRLITRILSPDSSLYESKIEEMEEKVFGDIESNGLLVLAANNTDLERVEKLLLLVVHFPNESATILSVIAEQRLNMESRTRSSKVFNENKK